MKNSAATEFSPPSKGTWRVGKVDLIVPVYKNKFLVSRCIDSLVNNIGEISANSPRLIVINDSPDDLEVTEYLRDASSKGVIDLLIENDRNVGFVKSVNKALAESRKRRASAILINSDTETFEGTLAELIAVADMDDQFAFVCPRSNNASICTFPRPPHIKAGKSLTPRSTFDVWSDLKDLLPRYFYAPTAIGFYMLIKSVVIRNFDALDERFGVGYEEENDLVMRAGKVGFRAVLANHAFAYHAGSASFTLTDIGLEDHRTANLRKMNDLHPEFLPNVRAFESSAEFRAELLLKGLLSGQDGALDIAFVLFSMGRHFNGTNEFIVNVLKRFVEITDERYTVTLLCDPDTAEFHGLDRLPGVRVTNKFDQVYAIAFNFGQPYDLHITNIMEMIAPVVVYTMHDVISLDCGPLRHSQNISELWEYVAETSNGLMFVSNFSEKTFIRRFPTTTASLFTRLHSTQTKCYAERYQNVARGARHIFVAGNHYDHKDSSRTGKLLANAFPSLSFLIFGVQGVYPPNAQLFRSGTVDDAEMLQLFCDSSVIVLPSYYEGFGFTFMHALAAGKPVVARDIPATREIIAKFEGLTGVYLFSDDAELQAALVLALEARSSSFTRELGDDWLDWARQFVSFVDQIASDRRNIYSTLVKRIKRGDEMRRKALHQALPGGLDASRNVTVEWKELADLPADRFVNSMYMHVLGRPADDVGKIHHLKLLQEGRSRPELIAALLSSQEYRDNGRNVRVEGLPKEKSGYKAIRRLRAIRGWLRQHPGERHV